MDRPQSTVHLDLSQMLTHLHQIAGSEGEETAVGMNSQGELVTQRSFQQPEPTFFGHIISLLPYSTAPESFDKCQERLQQYLADQTQKKKLMHRRVELQSLPTNSLPTVGSTYELGILLNTADTIPFKEGTAAYDRPEDNAPVRGAPRLRAGDMKILQRFIRARLGHQARGAVTTDQQAEEMVLAFYQQNAEAVVELYEYISTHEMNNSEQSKAMAKLEKLLIPYWNERPAPEPIQQSVAVSPVSKILLAAPFAQKAGQKADSYMEDLITHAKSQQRQGNALAAFETFRFVVEECKRENSPDHYDMAVRSMFDIKIEPDSPVTEEHYPVARLRGHLRTLSRNGDTFASEMINALPKPNPRKIVSSPTRIGQEHSPNRTPEITPKRIRNGNESTIPIAPMQSRAQYYTYEIQKEEDGVVKTYQRKADARQTKFSELYQKDKGYYDRTIKNPTISEQDLSNLEYRIEDNYRVVEEKIAKANAAVEQQRQRQDPGQDKHGQFLSHTTLGFQAFNTIEEAVSETPTNLPNAGIACAKGMRDYMEDAHVGSQFSFKAGETSVPVTIAGVFDGHAGRGGSGSAVAKRCARTVAEKLKTRLEEYNAGGLTRAGIWNALKLAPVDLDRDAVSPRAGTTACVALMIQGQLWVMNVGDSRAVLALDGGKSIQLSEDAKHREQQYVDSIEKRGGKVIGVRAFGPSNRGNIDALRSIGDHETQGSVSARSKVTCFPVTEEMRGAHLVVGCDGIFGAGTSDQVAQLVHHLKTTHPHISDEEIAREIVSHAYHAESSDNLTAIVMPIDSMGG